MERIPFGESALATRAPSYPSSWRAAVSGEAYDSSSIIGLFEERCPGSNKLYVEYASLTVVTVNGGEVQEENDNAGGRPQSQQVPKLLLIGVDCGILVHGLRVVSEERLRLFFCPVDLAIWKTEKRSKGC
jgi:hypothetical protein